MNILLMDNSLLNIFMIIISSKDNGFITDNIINYEILLILK